MSAEIAVVALDADDTLWHSEVYFERTQRRFTELVSRYTAPEVDVDARVLGEVEPLGRLGAAATAARRQRQKQPQAHRRGLDPCS